MTSSFVDPTTDRSNLCHRSASTADQQTTFTDDSVCCGNQVSHYQHHHQQHISQPSLGGSNVQFHWSGHDAQPKPWLAWPNNTWYSQASPGAHGNEYAAFGWNSSISQAYTNPPLSHGGYIETSQPATDNWLLQSSYHGAQDMSPVSWTYNPTPSGYNDLHRRDYQSHTHGKRSHDSSVDVKYSDTGDGHSENKPVNIGHYAFASPDGSLPPENYYPEKHNTGLWDWSQAMSKAVPLHPPLRTDFAIQDLEHTSEHGRASYFSKLRPSVAGPRNQTSPTSSCWDVDDNASPTTTATTTTATPTDLIPDPPTELLDPPSEDMDPSDKTMVPQKRNLKDPNHLYMPRWIRGDGKQREGWCGACRPGKWLSLKRSTYWYHKNFCHGITVMGTPFPRPTRTRALADDKGWEGYCGSCSKWIVLNGGKKSHTSWFRHAYKCDPSAVARSPPSRAFTY